jgi:ADP-heptose:LPS heptosyltransferase
MSANDLKRDAMTSFAGRLAAEFFSAHQSAGEYLREPAARLAEMSLSEDEETAKAASGAFFTSLVERLADSFDPAAVPVYNRLLAQLIELCRRTRRGSRMDRALASFGLQTEGDLVLRAECLRRVERLDLTGSRAPVIKRVIALSRVTIGADVAITTVIIERMKQQYPGAEIVLLCGGKMAELLGGDPRIRFRDIDYRRGGTATERLLSWIDLLAILGELTEGARQGEYLIVDPDSRLTQLGLLPVSPLDDYVFFPSREYGASTGRSLAELSSMWLDEVFGRELEMRPRLHLNRDDLNLAGEVAKQLRKSRARPVVTINFGVGGNALKRAGDHFERGLVGSLIQEGAAVLLDKGSGEEEAARAGAVIRHSLADNRTARSIEADEDNLKDLLESDSISRADLLAWRGRIGHLAAMIEQSDLYIGYDSAGQHIAAALGIPCIDVFAGFSSQRMLDRWRPTGPAASRVIAVETSGGPADEAGTLAETLGWARRFLRDEYHHT